MAVPGGRGGSTLGVPPASSRDSSAHLTGLPVLSALEAQPPHVPAAHLLLHVQRISLYISSRKKIWFTFCAEILQRWMMGSGYCFTSTLTQNWRHGNGNMQELCLKSWDSEPVFERIKWLILPENRRNLEYKHFLKYQPSFSRRQNKILIYSDQKKKLQ